MKVKDLIKELQQLNQDARVDIYVPCYVGEDSSFDYETSNFEIHASHSSPDEYNPYIEIYCLNGLDNFYNHYYYQLRRTTNGYR